MKQVGVLIALWMVAAPSVLAMSAGAPGASGSSQLFRCAACHQSPGAPSVLVDGLQDAVLRPGDSVRLSVVVQSALNETRRTGFGISSQAGTFHSDDADVSAPSPHELTHSTPRISSEGGLTQWTFDLQDLSVGRHRLFLGVNDANGDGQATGDRAVHLVLPVVVCDRDDVDTDGDGFGDGCDICPGVFDPDQADTDGDFIGDACDVCPSVSDPTQLDVDGDLIGDACDADTDDCALGLDTCSDNADCVDLPFRAFECACRPGFSGDGQVCDNVDECADDLDDCSEFALCEDSVGAFSCRCPDGFDGAGTVDDPCVDIDECAADDVCDDNADCTNSVGAFACECRAGFVGDGAGCADVDECLDAPCGEHATCDNAPGDFTCACEPGYVESDDDDGCVDIDECADGSAGCDNGCTNTDGGFVCDDDKDDKDDDDDDDEDDDPGGCAQATATPLALALMLLWRRRRPRRR